MKNKKKFKSAILKIVIIFIAFLVLSYISFTWNNVVKV